MTSGSSSPSGTLRLGVVGLGNMGAYHAQALRDGLIPECRLAAICDTAPDQRQGYGDTPAFSNLEDLIASGTVDAVLIATPHYSHTPLAIQALEAGLHVLLEKPMTVHKAEAEELLRAYRGRQQRQVFGLMFNQRTDPQYLKVRELVQSGALGQIRRIQWTITDWFRTEAYYRSSSWRATWAGEGGGVLLNQCVHNIDLFQWIFGLPWKVRSLCQFGLYHEIEVEDNVSAIFEYRDGATATFVTSTGEAPGSNRLEVAGENGKLVLEDGALTFTRNETPMSRFSQECPESYLRPGVWHSRIPLPESHGEQHIGVIKNFTQAVLHGAPLLAPASEGLHSVELTNAILLASIQDKAVELPLSAAEFSRVLRKLIAQSRPPKKAAVRKPKNTTRTHDFGASSRR